MTQSLLNVPELIMQQSALDINSNKISHIKFAIFDSCNLITVNLLSRSILTLAKTSRSYELSNAIFKI